MVYAGFWIRFGAKFLDNIILQVVGFGLGLVCGLVIRDAFIAPLVAGIAGFAVNIAYNTYFIGKFGATPGKMAAKLRVVTPEGGPISYGKAFGRVFGELLSGLTLGIGYIMAAFDDEKRALHDRVCNTRVIRTNV